MKNKRTGLSASLTLFGMVACLLVSLGGCDQQEPTSTSGAKKVTTTVPIGPDGMTIEQRLVERRLKEDNKIGAIKFAYCGSAMTGGVIYQSTVEGKVVSSGKRLSPRSIDYTGGTSLDGFAIEIGGKTHYTKEILSDDGTYGESIPYLFWWDVDSTYYQQYITGGTFFLVTSRPVDFNAQRLRFEAYVREHEAEYRAKDK